MREVDAWLWSVVGGVETHTLSRYRTAAPEMATADKTDVVATMADWASTPPGPLAAAVDALRAATKDGPRADVLLLHGILLEQLGVTLYGALAAGDRLEPDGRDLARRAHQASLVVRQRAANAWSTAVPSADDRFDAFCSRTGPVFAELDRFGAALDEAFAAPLGMRFVDLMGDYVADLLPVCTGDLGFQRRKVMVHLGQAFMG